MLYFRRNSSRIQEQRYTISPSVCPTGVLHGLLHINDMDSKSISGVTPDIELESISFRAIPGKST